MTLHWRPENGVPLSIIIPETGLRVTLDDFVPKSVVMAFLDTVPITKSPEYEALLKALGG